MSLLLSLAACDGEALPPPPTIGACSAPALALTVDLGADALVPEPDADERLSSFGVGLAVADFDGDGWDDVALAPVTGPGMVLRGDGAGGLDPQPAAFPAGLSLAAGDLDGDGAVDLVLGRQEGESDLLLYNDGGGGFAAYELPGSAGHTVTPTLADLDADGDLDLFVARHVTEPIYGNIQAGLLVGPGSSLYRNDGGRAWTDLTAQLPPEIAEGMAFIGSPLDADADGDLDVYLVHDFGDLLVPNQLLLNDGQANLSLSQDCGCNLAIAGMGGAVDDYDGDGAPDVHVTDLGSPHLLLNDGGGGFYDSTHASGAYVPSDGDRIGSWGNAAADIDQDGWVDLAVTYGPLIFWLSPEELEPIVLSDGELIEDQSRQRDLLLRNNGGSFSDISEEIGFAATDVGRAVAIADLDRDGRPDLVTAGWTAENTPYLRALRSAGGCPGGVTVAAPVGSRVEAEIGGETRVRWVLPAATFSSSAPEVHVGLGAADQADAITVTAIGGAAQSWADVAAGTRLVFGE